VAHIYAQAIDDATGMTIVAASSGEPSLSGAFAEGTKGGNLKGAEAVGTAIAERLIAKGIKQVVYDRNGFLYHGRVRALAEAARKAGLEF
jgi:large subunit ribosomal protein L18